MPLLAGRQFLVPPQTHSPEAESCLLPQQQCTDVIDTSVLELFLANLEAAIAVADDRLYV